VDTGRSNNKPRSYSDVAGDVDIYAKWASYDGSNIAVSGIFFDDVAPIDLKSYTNDDFTFYSQISAHVKSALPSSKNAVVFNPGTPAPTQLFGDTDTIVEFEVPFSEYKDESSIQEVPSSYRSKSAIMIHDTPESTDVGSLVHNMIADGIGAVYFGADCCYKYYSKTLLTATAEAILKG